MINFKNGDKASFFKILRRNSVDYLPLPTAFAEKYLEKGTNKKQTIVLKTKPGGVIWRVKYFKIEDRYYFMDGWLKFMKDNCLEKLDFLVFWFLSPENSIFQVFFYSPNGCLKRPTSCSNHLRRRLALPNIEHSELSGKEETSDDEDDSIDNMQGTFTKIDDTMENMQRPFTRTVRNSHLKSMPLKKGFAGIYGHCKVQLKNDEGKTLEVDVRRWNSGRTWIPVMVNQWSDFVKDNEVKVGDKCEITHVQGNLLHVHVIKETEK